MKKWTTTQNGQQSNAKIQQQRAGEDMKKRYLSFINPGVKGIQYM